MDLAISPLVRAQYVRPIHYAPPSQLYLLPPMSPIAKHATTFFAHAQELFHLKHSVWQ